MEKYWKEHGKWVLAVSGGADSMALLDMAYKQQMDIVVAHVNYQKRATANRDMNGVIDYCEKRGIPCFVHRVHRYRTNVNFQAQARDIRYTFFKEVMLLEGAQGVLVAHQQDDVLETYCLQMERNSIPYAFGIEKEIVVYGMVVKRPLLSWTKQELEMYCQQHQVPYFDDESNFEDDYRRNEIRHHVLPLWSEQQRQEALQMIAIKNNELKEQRKKIASYVNEMTQTFLLDWFLQIDKPLQSGVLREWLIKQGCGYHLSENHLQQILLVIHNKMKNKKHTINGHTFLQCEYGHVSLMKAEQETYAYTYGEECEWNEFNTPYFQIKNKGRVIEGITLSKEDYPIMIRNAQKGDKIQLRMGTKKVSRYFIDNKISHKLRETWPVVVNSKGNIIFVCGIGCDIEHYSNNPTLFVLKY